VFISIEIRLFGSFRAEDREFCRENASFAVRLQEALCGDLLARGIKVFGVGKRGLREDYRRAVLDRKFT
jgi:hypothetical protein